MNDAQRKDFSLLRNMESSAAADWILENHPQDGCIYVRARTWKVNDQIKLAEHFLKRIPHSSEICYKALLSVMSVSRFIGVLGQYMPSESSNRELLKYYLIPVLMSASKTKKDEAEVLRLKSELQN